MILLSVSDIRKHFGPDPVLAGVTFDIRPGERISLVGPNGAGKTTLMRILNGLEEADIGRVELHHDCRMGYLEQHPQFAPGRTVWDEAFAAFRDLTSLASEAEAVARELAEATSDEDRAQLGRRFDRLQHELQHRDGYNLDHRVEEVLEGLGFPRVAFRQPVEQLSGGQRNRLLLAKLLLEEPDLMLLDEPSNHLDIEATEWLENYLVASPQALLVVSHDRYFLDKVTVRTLELFRGTIEDYPGNFTQYQRLKGERLEVQRRTFEKQQQEIAKIEEFIRKNHYGQKSLQAEDRRKKLERIERVDPPREIYTPPMGFPAASRTGDIVLRVEHLSKSFDRPLFGDITFDLLRGEKWGIIGPNGTGKTTLLKCLLGLLPTDDGRVMTGSGVKLAYFDQLLSFTDTSERAVDAVRPSHKEMIDQQRRDLLTRFGITGDMVFQPVSSLSGGERNRTALAKIAATDSNVLILDEPTNHLDLWSRDSLERSLRQFDGSVLFVSHDRYFLNQVADHLLVVEPGRFRVIEGNYDTYQHLVRAGLAGAKPVAKGSAKEPASAAASPPANKEKAAKRKRRFPYRKAAEIEAEIATREARILELHELFGAPDVLRDGNKVKQLKGELDEHQQALPLLYEHWEEATELNG